MEVNQILSIIDEYQYTLPETIEDKIDLPTQIDENISWITILPKCGITKHSIWLLQQPQSNEKQLLTSNV